MSTNNTTVKTANILISVLILVAVAAITIFFLTKKTKDYLQGQAEIGRAHV